MSKVDRVNYDESLIIRIVTNIVAKTPGVNIDGAFNVSINDAHTNIDIVFTPQKVIVNPYMIAEEVQKNVYFNMKKNFDLYNITINVKVAGGGINNA